METIDLDPAVVKIDKPQASDPSGAAPKGPLAAPQDPPPSRISVKRKDEIEPVPDFGAMLARWDDDPEQKILVKLFDRSDQALRRRLFQAAREWVPLSAGFRGEFVQFCKGRKIVGKGDLALVRLLFGSATDPKRVSDYAKVVRYWSEHQEADEQTAITTPLASIWRQERRLKAAADAEGVTADADNLPDLLGDRPPDVEIRNQGFGEPGPRMFAAVVLEDGTMRLWAVNTIPYRVRLSAIRDALSSPPPKTVVIKAAPRPATSP